MSDSKKQSENYGGFGDSDDQTFSQSSKNKGKSELSHGGANAENDKADAINSNEKSGFISYLNIDPIPEPKKHSNKKYVIAVITLLAVSAMIWLILPSEKPKVDPIAMKGSTAVDTATTIIEPGKSEQELLQQTLEQDSIAKVQDYLARMQMAEGKPLGNNENGSEISSATEKAPEKKVAPPDPLPAESVSESDKKTSVASKESESIQFDKSKQLNRISSKHIQKSIPKPLAKKNISNNPKAEITPKKKEISKQQVLDETFVDAGKIENKKPNTEKLEKKNTSNEKYSVQVFSSISKEEADNRLKTLKSKGVGSAFISKQSLKGKTWYRVRFGTYGSREEAKKAASKVGYSQAWIDRVQ